MRGFDPSFNAITGLNGSGKSNILDAICFVLGLTNLSSVRASNIQDLIYKRGQAGVTKASVTIIFDNSDKERSPVAFEAYATITVTRQIAMGGASKYLINGHKATQQAVQNLFQSVQLNVNNPNFLIMQGKVTKVLNMKPAEVLNMIEEATGTRMFEERKERAFRTMAKKDQKVREITMLLDEEIKPKLDKLREEKRAFLEYQKGATELERLQRLSKAHEWQTLHVQLATNEAETVAATRSSLEQTRDDMQRWTQQLASLQHELDALEQQRAGRDGDSAQAAHAKALARELVEKQAQRGVCHAALDEERERERSETAALDAARAALATLAASFEEHQASFDAFQHEHAAASTDLGEQEALLQSLLTGVSGSDHTPGGFQGQLAEARERRAAAQRASEQARLKIAHLEKEIAAKTPQLQREQKSSAPLAAQLADAQQRVAAAEARVAHHAFDAAALDALARERASLSDTIAQLREQHDALQARLPAALQFTYADPSPDFDRASVKGLVASLVRLDPDKHEYATALETCAGGRLYSVVVRDEHVGAQLLARGQLKKRVTLIPLTKIQAHVAPPAKVSAAQRLAPNKVELALSLVGYEPELARALEYVFGSTLVCRDAATAKKVTFDAAVRLKSVTLDGDVYDPSGTLSGGSSAPAQASVLLRMQELAGVATSLAQHTRALRDTDDAWRALSDARAEAQALGHELERLRHHVSLLEQQRAGGRAAVLAAEIDAARRQIEDLQQAIRDANASATDAAALVTQLERDIAELHTDKDAKIERVRDKVQRLKRAHAARSQELKTRQAALRAAELELAQHRMDVDAAQERVDDATRAAAQAQDDGARADEACAALEARLAECHAALEEERAAHAAREDEYAALHAAHAAKTDALHAAQLDEKRLARELEQSEAAGVSLRRTLEALEAEHAWLRDDAPLFGQPGSAYEFSKHNMRDVNKLCAQLEEQQAGMRRRVNPRVMNMIDNVEKKDASLQHMLSTVLKDKSKIEQTIAELDRYKTDALRTTFEQVNRDFGAIFGELLPGNYAQLQPPDGADITQGLEVRVRLGQTWKQSLTELSGGQRSLIALSLIMSLLQFNPAPMYILDEVDAALDLSHTQHIGQLFRTRFKGSQFIVVSLKEGLFTNANVLFRARFRDGTSIVERHAQTPHEPKALRPLAGMAKASESESQRGVGRPP